MNETRQAFLDELYAHGRAHDEQREDRLQRLRNVEPETAELLGVLVRSHAAKRVLEIGTSNGYSTIWLGDAAEAVGGTVLSLEIEADRTAHDPNRLGVHLLGWDRRLSRVAGRRLSLLGEAVRRMPAGRRRAPDGRRAPDPA